MKPKSINIPTTLPLTTTCAGGNVIPTTTNSVHQPIIDMNLLATTHVSYANAPFVAISRMISVFVGGSPSKIIIKEEKVATMPFPTVLMCSALEASATIHVDALCEEEQDDSAFEVLVRSFLLLCFVSNLFFSH